MLELTGVVTFTNTDPAAWAGETAVIDVSLLTIKLAAGVPPKETAVVPVKPEPVMVTDVPPAAGPLVGLMAEITGTAI